MALNVALPLSGLLPELLYARCALLSPLPQDFEENLELLVTPYDSSESGIGSPSDNKDPKSSSEDDEPSSTSSASSISSTSPTPQVKPEPPAAPTTVQQVWKLKIEYQGRDILDLGKNLTDSSWKFQYARLPDNNVSMFMANRSQYHRLGANGLNREYELATCHKCTFPFPVNCPNIIYNIDGAKNAKHNDGANAKPMQSNEKAQNNLPSFKMYKHF